MKKNYFKIFMFFISLSAFAQQPYYSNVDLTLTGIPLRDALATKVIATHTNNLSYTPGIWEACKITDEDPNNPSNVLLLYGWENGTDADVTNDLSRSKTNTGGGVGQWNREHTYAKSLGTPNLGTSGPGADAHHLRSADVQRNGARGSLKFIAGSGNSGVSGSGWYPGDASLGGTDWRGDVARMIMYMYIRYGNQCLPSGAVIGTTNSVDANMINLLLEWNAADPPSAIEDARNTYHDGTGTYAQGNRNPFIDEPYLATIIWGGTPALDRWGIYTAPDNTAPTVPTNLVVSNPTSTTIDLTWTASTDNVGVTGYDIYVDGVFNSTSATNSITITGLTPSTTYSFTVLAKDNAGNASAQSAAVNGTTTAPDTIAPSVPTNLTTLNPSSSTMDLTWTASTDNVGVTAYDIYVNGVFNATSATNSTTVTGLAASTTYSFTVLAKDAAGNTSAQSTAVNGTTLAASTGGTDLFFSEYMEGSGNNKALEIANITGSPVNLSIYTIKLSANGATGWTTGTYTLPNVTLASNDVFVIANSGIAVCTGVVDVFANSVCTFNGNDAVGLFKNNVLIDILGTLGNSANYAKNTTLVRNATVVSPNTTYTPSEWTIFASNTCTDLGTHTSTVLGLENVALSKIKIYPNPAYSNELNIATDQDLVVEIFNILGKQVLKETTANGNSINISSLKSGVYFVKLSSDKGTATKKFIKQ